MQDIGHSDDEVPFLYPNNLDPRIDIDPTRKCRVDV